MERDKIMKIGTLVKNNGVGDKNPSRIFIYTGISGEYANGLELIDGKLEKTRYYKRDFKKEDIFQIIGYTNGFEVLKDDLKKLLDMEK